MSVEQETGVVGEAERASFERDGYLEIETELSDSVLDGVIEDLSKVYGDLQPDGTVIYRMFTRQQDYWRESGNVKQLVLLPRVLNALRELYGREPLPFQTLNFPLGTEQRVHSDAYHFNSMPSGYMCGVWIALEDMDMDNGPLVYYPGSHKLPELWPKDIGVPKGKDHYEEYETYLEKLIAEKGLEPRYATVKKGTAFIWASNLLHGGSARRDTSRTRHSQVTHYFFEGCKYYTPMYSDDEEVLWRDPNWIT
jgi:ectoine hydroxylase-related dioxygenase (phytanoyl-CoA dioxygenase family)